MKKPQYYSYGEYASSNYGAHTLCFVIDNRRYFFSYQTLVAFDGVDGLKVIQNYWSTTTGKHLNWIDGGKKENRLTEEEFKAELEKIGGEPDTKEHVLKWIISEAWTLLEPREDEHADNWRSYAEQHAPDYIRAYTRDHENV